MTNFQNIGALAGINYYYQIHYENKTTMIVGLFEYLELKNSEEISTFYIDFTLSIIFYD